MKVVVVHLLLLTGGKPSQIQRLKFGVLQNPIKFGPFQYKYASFITKNHFPLKLKKKNKYPPSPLEHIILEHHRCKCAEPTKWQAWLILSSSFLRSSLFLAAMSSSRSDVVTQFVRLFVRSFVCVSVPFFSFSVIEVSSSPKEFQWCFKAV